MKKILLFAAAALTMTVGCQKIQELINPDKQQPVDDATPVEITFNTNVAANLQTKGSGAVEDFDGNQKLFIYGLNVTSGTKEIANQEAKATVAASENGETSGALTWADPAFAQFYNGTTDVYEFYGYHVDDADVTTEFSETNYVSVITIDGTQDIMLAKADPATDVQKAKDAGVFKGEASWNDGYAYSAYAARRGVQPSLTFKHQLVRFTFQIISGTNYETAGDPEKNLYIKGLTMSARNSAQLCVAGKNLGLTSIQSELAELPLRSLVDGQLTDLQVYEVPSADAEIEEGSNVIGESLMVIPNDYVAGGDAYPMSLVMEQAGKTITYPVDLKFSSVTGAPSGQTQFTAGYSYRVTVKVYGLEQVELSAELEPWLPGGDIEINTDDAPEIF